MLLTFRMYNMIISRSLVRLESAKKEIGKSSATKCSYVTLEERGSNNKPRIRDLKSHET